MKKKLIFFVVVLVIIVLCNPLASSLALSFDPGIELSTQAITLINLDTGTPVYQKNSDNKMYPASLTKVMTYIITVENILDLKNTKITVSERLIDSLSGTESSLSDIKSGETLSVYDLLNCLMLPSGNDAAMVLADYVGNGDINSFVEMMNSKANELGCQNTHFVNPTGLHNENHYTTTNDYTTITQYAMGLPYFTYISSQTEYTVPQTNVQEERTLVTTNKMMLEYYPEYFYKYTSGIKTGWHDQAGYCIVSSAKADGYSYLCVAMGAPSSDASGNKIETNSAMLDSKELYRWALTTFEIKSIMSASTPVDEIPVNYAWGQDTVLLAPEKDVTYLLPKDANVSDVLLNVTEKPDSVDAPIKKGEVIGKATLTYANQELTTINLVADSDVQRSDILYYVQMIRNLFSNPLFVIVLFIFIVLLIMYIFAVGTYNRKTNKRSKNRRNF